MYKQAKAYTTWRAWWKELCHQRDRLLAAAKKFRHGQLLASWNKWVYEAAEMRRQKRQMARAFVRILQRHLAMAFVKWQTEVANRNYQRGRMERAARQLCNTAMARGFQTWLAVTREIMRKLFMLKGTLHRVIHRHLSAAFEKWQDEVDRMKAQAELMRSAVSTLLYEDLSKVSLFKV